MPLSRKVTPPAEIICLRAPLDVFRVGKAPRTEPACRSRRSGKRADFLRQIAPSARDGRPRPWSERAMQTTHSARRQEMFRACERFLNGHGSHRMQDELAVLAAAAAEQIAMRLHGESTRCWRIAFHPTCHLERHEQRPLWLPARARCLKRCRRKPTGPGNAASRCTWTARGCGSAPGHCSSRRAKVKRRAYWGRPRLPMDFASGPHKCHNEFNPARI